MPLKLKRGTDWSTTWTRRRPAAAEAFHGDAEALHGNFASYSALPSDLRASHAGG